MNQFSRWRTDIELELYCVKTSFHACRLLITVGYGVNSIAAGTEHRYINHVIDFNGQETWQTIRIPFNAGQEFLRTFNGGSGEQIRNFSQGVVKITVLNPLKVSGQVVATSVEVVTFCKLINTVVALPKPSPLVYADTTAAPQLYAQGPTAEALENKGEITVTTEETSPVQQSKPCQLNVGRKFEFTVTNVTEIVRRFKEFQWVAQPLVNVQNVNAAGPQKGRGSTGTVVALPVSINNFYSSLYKGWSGTIKYRIFGRTSDLIRVWYDPDACVVGTNTAQAAGNQAIPSYTATSNWSANVLVKQGININGYPAVEVTYDTSQETGWIDVSIPYCSEKNFLPTNYGRTDGSANELYSNGTLYIHTENTVNLVDGTNLTVFQAAGDDFRFHCFCPNDNYRICAYNNVDAAPGNLPETASGGGYLFGNRLTTNIV